VNHPDDNSNALPARGDLFANPAAAAVWAAIQHLPEKTKHALLEHLTAHLAIPELGRTKQQIKEARAVVALREARELLADDEQLTPEAYERLRAAHVKREWSPESSVRRWFNGSWNDALRAAGLDALPAGDALVIPQGGAYTKEELLRAVRECADEKGQPVTLSEYLAWARRAEVRARPGRRPVSQPVVDRLFPDGWHSVLFAAGVLKEGATGRTAADGKVFPSVYRYPDEDMRIALRECAQALGKSPTVADYERWRRAVVGERDEDGGPVRCVPSYNAMLRRFGYWDDVLIAAGLSPRGGRAVRDVPPRPRRKSPRFNESEVLAAIREAHAACGSPFTVAAYVAWREGQIERDRAAGRFRKLPSLDAIRSRFGRWDQAVKRALEEGQ